ncbi:MAG: DEAD/DEAH box helicase [Phycisphaeraceae bacterium]
MQFSDLGLAEPILRAVADEGYDTATPIQAQTIPHILAGGDALGSAQTGTGKTAAFALPVLSRLLEAGVISETRGDPSSSHKASSNRQGRGRGRNRGGNGHGKSNRNAAPASHRPIRCLVLCPTRELAAQISDSFATYGRHTDVRTAEIVGGVSQRPLTAALERGIDICIATPGRLLDLIEQDHVHLDRVDSFILDEADRMLDMGFINDIRKIMKRVPEQRQTLLFSATLPPAIRKLSNDLLTDPAVVDVSPKTTTAERVTQCVCHVQKPNKTPLLVHYFDHLNMDRSIVFTRTKHGADKVTRQLQKAGVEAVAIHGNKSQNQRQAALDRFKAGKLGVLVATDVAARGIDIDEVSHVVNYDVPRDAESYVHRIGRTARAGADGVAITFCENEERPFLADIEKLISIRIEIRNDVEGLTEAEPDTPMPRGTGKRGSKSQGKGAGGGKPRHANAKSKPRAAHPLSHTPNDSDGRKPRNRGKSSRNARGQTQRRRGRSA